MTPESEVPGTKLSGTTSILSLRFRGFEEGGFGGKGLFNLAAVAGEGALGSEGGSFSLDDFGFREGLGLVEELGLDEEGSSAEGESLKIGFLGSMKCFIAEKLFTEKKKRVESGEDKEAREREERDRKRERVRARDRK